MSRAFLIVMDSVGIGGAPDADRFFNDGAPDTGANTVGHIAQACADGRAEEGRSGPLNMPTLAGLGLGAGVKLASGEEAPGLMVEPVGLWGAATEISPSKDTPSGHWELAGVPVPWEWHYFPDQKNSFPPDLVAKACEIAGTDGILGNCHASGSSGTLFVVFLFATLRQNRKIRVPLKRKYNQLDTTQQHNGCGRGG